MHQIIPVENWHKSTYSGSQGDCVEVAETPAFSAIWDTKNRELGALFFSDREWRAFLRAAEVDLG